jgi:hypothetical protein
VKVLQGLTKTSQFPVIKNTEGKECGINGRVFARMHQALGSISSNTKKVEKFAYT